MLCFCMQRLVSRVLSSNSFMKAETLSLRFQNNDLQVPDPLEVLHQISSSCIN